MPELPEVETVRRGLEPVMSGARIIAARQNRPDLRCPFPERFVERLTGAEVRGLARRAKYILAERSSGETLILHLGMSGSFRIVTPEAGAAGIAASSGPVAGAAFNHPRNEAAPHDHFILTMSNGSEIVYNDPRRFGFALLCATDALPHHPHLAHLGIEPLSNALNGKSLNTALRGRRTPLKTALLDQRIVCGLGNIYVCEALFRAGLSPRRTAHSITSARGTTGRTERLARAIRGTLDDALAAGGSTLRDFAHADGSLGYFQHAFQVYDREGMACPRSGCNGTVTRLVQSGRSTFHCARCQR